MDNGLETALFVLSFGAALGSGLVAGILFAFSNFVMPALARLRPEQGIAAMQAINITVMNTLFLALFVGTAALCLSLLGLTLWSWGQPGSAPRVGAAFAYLVGCIGVTRLGNIPLNDALARVDATASEAAPFWSRYLRAWLRYNHLRTAAALLTAMLLTWTLGRG